MSKMNKTKIKFLIIATVFSGILGGLSYSRVSACKLHKSVIKSDICNPLLSGSGSAEEDAKELEDIGGSGFHTIELSRRKRADIERRTQNGTVLDLSPLDRAIRKLESLEAKEGGCCGLFTPKVDAGEEKFVDIIRTLQDTKQMTEKSAGQMYTKACEDLKSCRSVPLYAYLVGVYSKCMDYKNSLPEKPNTRLLKKRVQTINKMIDVFSVKNLFPNISDDIDLSGEIPLDFYFEKTEEIYGNESTDEVTKRMQLVIDRFSFI